MNKLIVAACLATAVSMMADTAMADSIKEMFGVSAKVGVLIPADNHSDFYHNDTNSAFVAGAGFIYGIDNNIATELDLTYTTFGSETGDFGITDVSIGMQYRFINFHRRLVPYIGVGMDVLGNTYDPNNGTSRDVDVTIGAHISGGVDYFLQKRLALIAEAKAVIAASTDITDKDGNHTGNFDPSSFSTTIGFRCFFK